jgi:integrase
MPYKEKCGKWRAEVKSPRRRTKLFDKKKDAIDWENAIRRELELAEQREQDLQNCEVEPLSLGEWFELYLDDKQIKVSTDTYVEKKSLGKRFIAFMGSEGFMAAELRPAQVNKYLIQQARNRGGNAANKDRKNLNAAWNWGIKYHDFPEKNPIKKTDRFPETRHPRYVPPLEDFIKVLNTAQGQEKVLLLSYYFTAARCKEILRLRWDEVNFGAKTLTLWTRKRKNSDWESDEVQVPDELIQDLKKHKLGQMPSEHVFTQPGKTEPYAVNRRMMERLCDRAKVKPFGHHGIRHLAASIAMDAEAHVLDIQKLLRHQSLATTLKYIHRMRKRNAAVDILGENLSRATQTGHINKEGVAA